MDIFGVVDLPIWLVLLLASSLLYVYYMSSTHRIFKKLGIPGPRPLPVLGNSIYVLRHGLIDTVINGYKHFKKDKMYGVFEGKTPILTVTDLDMLKEIMVKQFNNFTDRREYAGFNQPGVDSIMFNARGEAWKQYRTLLKPSLNSARLKMLHPRIEVILETMITVMKEKCVKDEQMEISEVMGTFCMDVIANICFDIDANSLRDPKNKFMTTARAVLDDFGERNFGYELFAPPFLKKFLDFFGILILKREHIMFLRDFTTKALNSRKSNKDNPKDLFQYMIDNSVLSSHPTKGRVFTLEEIYGSSLTYFLAGYDTAAKGLFFALYHIGYHQECFRRAQQEVDDELQGETPDPTNVQKLKYIDMCIKESNRLYPLGFYVERCCNKDTTVLGHRIPKGMNIRVPIAGIHRDPEIYPNPDQYDPERFTPENMEKRHQMSYLAFGSGPRACFGEPLATLLMRIGIAAVLQNFDLSPCQKSEYPIRIIPLSDINPAHGLWLNVKPRK